jgi:hypothetical protein
MGDLLTRLSPGTTLLRAVLAGGLQVVRLFLRRISKALVSEAHFIWIVRNSLVIVAVAMLAGTAFVVNRRDGIAKQTAEMPESAKCS